MPVYVISDVSRSDPALIREYLALARPAVAKYGGRYLASSEDVESVEGDWTPARVAIVEFESMERAREWYGSPEYAPALVIRERALERRLIFVEGAVQS